MKSGLKIVVGIATAGRREQLTRTLRLLARHSRLPDRIVICPAGVDDYDEAAAATVPFPIEVVRGPRGLPAQRNCVLARCADADAVVFFDDDFYPAPSYLEEVEAMLIRHPDVVIARGRALADGAAGPGIGHEEALRILGSVPALPPAEAAMSDIYGAYGCNMTVRMMPVLAHGIRFDENLPLYAWLEDIDFSRGMAPYGRVVINLRLCGVHLGTKQGRTSGLKFGYSQIANPIYMVRKGTMSRSYAYRQMARNVARNIFRFVVPEPWVDRRGRLKGNVLAMLDLFRGGSDPRKILLLD